MSDIATPRISILLPVYNGARYLADAIDSILNQSFSEFELVIVNDGSKDHSARIVAGYTDTRIRYFEQENQGLPATLNRAASQAHGEYLFRQDQDDISHPNRLERQVAFLDQHPEIGIVGSWARIFSENSDVKPERIHRHPAGTSAIAFSVLFDTPFVHSSVAIRRSVFEAVGGYSCDRERQPPEDFELWSRICRFSAGANLPEILVDYREVPGSMSRTLQDVFAERMIKISHENLAHWLKDSDYASIAPTLARLYHFRNGYQSAEEYEETAGALHYISQKIDQYYPGGQDELVRCLQDMLYWFRRSYVLGHCNGAIDRLLVKVFFRALRIVQHYH
ncbi:MAG TPA: glycosyltransferase [Methylophilaceae bacterium]|nr:glycosyltransferase [Methylophilaceae bacterium]